MITGKQKQNKRQERSIMLISDSELLPNLNSLIDTVKNEVLL